MRVEIEFEERPIHRAPLAVLEHLYYYTTQYGLSVRQFTGRHWEYWEKLPERLRNAQGKPAQLDQIIAELASLAAGSRERREKRRAQVACKWAQKETVLNAQLLSVLAAMPADLLALGVGNMIPAGGIDRGLRVVDLRMQGPNGEHVDFLEPDLLLLGDGYLLMGEVKARGSYNRVGSYRPNQLLNYLHLVAKCHESDEPSLPGRFVHLILVPSLDPKWLDKHSEWVLGIEDENGRLTIDPDACIALSKRKSSYDYDVLRQLASEVPIYYRSWRQLHGAFGVAVEQFGDARNAGHWHRIVGEIGELAQRAAYAR